MYVFSVPPIGNGPTRPIRGPTRETRRDETSGGDDDEEEDRG